MASEIANPLLLLRAFYSIFLSVVEKREKSGTSGSAAPANLMYFIVRTAKTCGRLLKRLIIKIK